MKRIGLMLILTLTVLSVWAQSPEVPTRLEFAGMKLRLTNDAREEVQGYVDALTAHPRYFQQKVDLMDLYYPLVEPVLEEEGVPADIKFLLAQESSFIADAVSSSNAVGYWQFKDFTGREVGLRIDGYIDERMHIIESSRGAAKYLKRHNFHFQNWVHAIIAYHQGFSGAQKRVDEKENGASRMTIDKNTFWYFKKFLAHKIAFEDALGQNNNPPLKLDQYHKTAGKSLKQLAKELNVDYEEFQKYNKWLRRGKVPSEKTYIAIVPLRNQSLPQTIDREAPVLVSNRNHEKSSSKYYIQLGMSLKEAQQKSEEICLINGLPAVVATEKDDLSALAELGDITERRFRRYNDMSRRSTVKAGQIYYFDKKHRKAQVHYHTVREGETLWEIAQLYGLRLKRLKRKNRMRRRDVDIQVGRILWMRFIRPSNHPIEFIPQSERQAIAYLDTLPALPLREPPEQVASIEPLESQMTLEEEEEVVEEQPEKPEIEELQLADANEADVVENTENTVDSSATTTEPEPEPVPTTELKEQKEEEAIDWNEWDADPPEHIFTDDKNHKDQEHHRKSNTSVNTADRLIEHIVEKGDTYYGISRKYGIAINDLLEWNSLTIDQPLALGAVLQIQQTQSREQKVQEEEVPAETDHFHTVKAGETLYAISRKYEVSVKELLDWNGKGDFNVKVGERIRIKPE